MGFDLYAKNKEAGDNDYFRADIYAMYFFRCAVRRAGVPEKLIFSKFYGNGGPAKQALEVGEKLEKWLTGKSLVISLVEPNPMWGNIISGLENTLGASRKGGAKTRFSSEQGGSVPVKLRRQDWDFLASFARYCKESRGFRVY